MNHNIKRLLVLIHNAQFAETKDDALKAIQDYTKGLEKELRRKQGYPHHYHKNEYWVRIKEILGK